MLHYCAIVGWAEGVRCLLTLGAEKEIESQRKRLPLDFAVTMNHGRCAKLLAK